MSKFIILFIFILSNQVESQEIYELYNSPALLGMGDAGVTMADDENCHFYNPSAISAKRASQGVRFNLINPSFAFNKNLYKATKYILPGGLSDIVDYLKQTPENMYHLRFNMLPSISLRNFSLALLVQSNIDARNTGTFSETDPLDPMFAVNSTHDIIPTATLSFPFIGGILRTGINAKLIWRAQLNQNMAYSDLVGKSFTDLMREGWGMSYDAGVMLTLPIKHFPKFSLVAHNLGGTKFHQTRGVITDNPVGVPDDLKQTFDFGYSLFFFVTKDIKVTYAIDYRDILNANNSVWFKKVHTGLQFDIGKTKDLPIFQLRAGLNQLTWTAGFSLNSEFSSVEFSTYGEELSSNKVWGSVDRRYVVRYVIGL